MKVIHIISNLNIGGAEIQLLRLAKEQINQNLDVTIFVLTNNENALKAFDDPRLKILFPKSFNKIYFLGFFLLLKKIIKTDFQIIHSWMYHSDFIGSIISIIKMRPIIWSIRNSSVGKGVNFITRMIFVLNSFLSWFVPKKIICVSNKGIKYHSKYLYNQKKFELIKNGYEIKNKIPEKNINSRLTVGSLARFNEFKGHSFLIDIISKCESEINFILGGKNINNQNSCFDKIINLPNVLLLDEIENAEKFYSSIDVFFLHSKSEGFPNVLIEAILNNCLVISTDVGDVSEIVNQKFIMKYGDTNKALSILSELVEFHIDEIEKLKKEQYNKVKNQFDIKTISNNIKELYSNYV